MQNYKIKFTKLQNYKIINLLDNTPNQPCKFKTKTEDRRGTEKGNR